MDIYSTHHLRHRRLVRRSGEDDLQNLFASYFLRKDKTLSPVIGALSTTSVRKSGLGLLNPVTSAKEKYLSSTRVSAELTRAVTGGGGFSNAKHLRTLSEECRDGKDSRDVAYKSRLNGLVRNIQGTNKCLFLRAKITGAWLSVSGTTVLGTVLSATEFQDFLCTSYNVSPANLQSHCAGCGTMFRVMHALSCIIGSLIVARHNEIREELLYLS